MLTKSTLRLILLILLTLPNLPLHAASVNIPAVLLEQVDKLTDNGVEHNSYRYFSVNVDRRAQFLFQTERRIKSTSNATPFTISESEQKTILQALNFGTVADIEYTALAVRPTGSDRLIRLRAITLDGAKNALLMLNPDGKISHLPWLGLTPRFSPDGKFLAGTQLLTDKAGVPRFEIAIYTVKTGDARSITADLKDSACNPQWSPDGKWLAYDLVDPTYQTSYVDCFWGRGVAAERFPDGSDWVLLSTALPPGTDNVHLIRWER